jgi:hypothetical protein
MLTELVGAQNAAAAAANGLVVDDRELSDSVSVVPSR